MKFEMKQAVVKILRFSKPEVDYVYETQLHGQTVLVTRYKAHPRKELDTIPCIPALYSNGVANQIIEGATIEVYNNN